MKNKGTSQHTLAALALAVLIASSFAVSGQDKSDKSLYERVGATTRWPL